MASKEPLTPAPIEGEYLNPEPNDLDEILRYLRKSAEAIEVLLVRTESTYRELKSLKLKLETTKAYAAKMVEERKKS